MSQMDWLATAGKDILNDMKRVGVLVGREKTFPEAIIRGINERGNGAVIAEYIKLGGIEFDAPPKYDLVIDRISHEVPFYRAWPSRERSLSTIHFGGLRTTSSSTTHWVAS
jgi:hypothetical protein